MSESKHTIIIPLPKIEQHKNINNFENIKLTITTPLSDIISQGTLNKRTTIPNSFFTFTISKYIFRFDYRGEKVSLDNAYLDYCNNKELVGIIEDNLELYTEEYKVLPVFPMISRDVLDRKKNDLYHIVGQLHQIFSNISDSFFRKHANIDRCGKTEKSYSYLVMNPSYVLNKNNRETILEHIKKIIVEKLKEDDAYIKELIKHPEKMKNIEVKLEDEISNVFYETRGRNRGKTFIINFDKSDTSLSAISKKIYIANQIRLWSDGKKWHIFFSHREHDKITETFMKNKVLNYNIFKDKIK